MSGQPEMPEHVLVEANLPDDLLEEARQYAENAGQTLHDFIVEAVEMYVELLEVENDGGRRKE